MNKKLIIKIVMIIILTILIISIFCSNSMAFSTGIYKKIYDGTIPQKLKDVGNPLIGIVQVAGTGVAVIMLIVSAIKFMTASPEGKAQIKAQLIVYVIGAILLFAGTNIFATIARATQDVGKSDYERQWEQQQEEQQ